jgi:hypothetical protein
MKTRQEDGENQLLFNLSIPRELQVMARKKYIAQDRRRAIKSSSTVVP